MYLVPRTFEDVERRLVLVAVAVVRSARLELDEVELERLSKEGLVSRAEHPPRPRQTIVGVAGMPDRRVVGDRPGPPHAGCRALASAEFGEPVGLGADAA